MAHTGVAKGVVGARFALSSDLPAATRPGSVSGSSSTSLSFVSTTKKETGLVAPSAGLRARVVSTTASAARLRVSASSAVASEKPSTVPEIVLQPIKEISGVVKLPGSKSLSNRILLLAALSEVISINFSCPDSPFSGFISR